MRISETLIDDGKRQCMCGLLLRYHIEITGVTLKQTNFPEFLLSYSDAKVNYQRFDDPEYLLHCPGCGEALPKAVIP